MAAKKRSRNLRRRRPSRRKRVQEELNMEEKRTLFLKEQTLLAKERTILSFMRTGLTFITVGFAIVAAGPILYENLKVNTLASFIVGVGIAGVGFIEIVESVRRLRSYKTKMEEIKSKLGDDDV
jgi:uncharacterized membrane protein YidH (DUF202 family)